jgi:SpoVK/Ycf46/Vps4 family AAA+-type ATPase
MGAEAVMQEIRDLVGLENVKQHAEALVRYRANCLAQAIAWPPGDAQHLLLFGPPGVGKTTVARLFARLFQELGILQGGGVRKVSGTDLKITQKKAGDLVEPYVGHTEHKVRKVFEDALGGVLFIDEAYTLTPSEDTGGDFNAQVIHVINELTEEYRNRLAVFLVFYTVEQWEEWLAINPGLDSRFTTHIRFDVYSPADLVRVVETLARQQGFCLSPHGREALASVLAQPVVQRVLQDENARGARNILEHAIREHARRLAGGGSVADLSTILDVDVLQGVRRFLRRRGLDATDPGVIIELHDTVDASGTGVVADGNVSLAVEALRAKVRNEVVRAWTDEQVRLLLTTMARSRAGLTALEVTKHLVLFGNPGTGKTTFAEALGPLYKALGVIRNGTVNKIRGRDLVGQFRGETHNLAKSTLEKYRGGLIVLDEAYALLPTKARGDEKEADFHRLAIHVLNEFLEERRSDTAVVLVFYTREQFDEFARINEGLTSRLPAALEFPDVTEDEFVDASRDFLRERGGFTLSDDAERALRGWLDRTGIPFGNNRAARARMERARMSAIVRHPLLRVVESHDIEVATHAAPLLTPQVVPPVPPPVAVAPVLPSASMAAQSEEDEPTRHARGLASDDRDAMYRARAWLLFTVLGHPGQEQALTRFAAHGGFVALVSAAGRAPVDGGYDLSRDLLGAIPDIAKASATCRGHIASIVAELMPLATAPGGPKFALACQVLFALTAPGAHTVDQVLTCLVAPPFATRLMEAARGTPAGEICMWGHRDLMVVLARMAGASSAFREEWSSAALATEAVKHAPRNVIMLLGQSFGPDDHATAIFRGYELEWRKNLPILEDFMLSRCNRQTPVLQMHDDATCFLLMPHVDHATGARVLRALLATWTTVIRGMDRFVGKEFYTYRTAIRRLAAFGDHLRDRWVPYRQACVPELRALREAIVDKLDAPGHRNELQQDLAAFTRRLAGWC